MAEVPVCDVLCDAVEYLSKLGANLRTRSENLKEKKISKSKLRNSHAVQKAASKLLLICEISKKSLDNVERGMKNILNIVNAAQLQNASGSDSKSSKSSDSKYQYFEYETFKLRISKKVPVKHYMSVKVYTKSLPSSTIEKYPVYCDCKLFRLREKQAKKSKDLESSKSHLSCNDENNLKPNTPSTKKQTAKRSKKQIYSSDSDESPIGANKESHVQQVDCDGENTNKDDNDIDSTTMPETSKEEQTIQSPELNVNKNIDSDTNDKDTPKVKKVVRFANDSHVDEKEPDKEFIKKVKDKLKEETIENRESNDESSDNDVICVSPDVVNNQTKKLDTDSDNSVASGNKEPKKKPLIKCVSLSKLLKPNIINTIANKHIAKMKTSEDAKPKSPRTYSKIKKSNKQKEEEEYWECKRKEVSAFKSKTFSIRILRLPELTDEFMAKYKLKKITKAGSLIKDCGYDDNTSNVRILITPPIQEPEYVKEMGNESEKDKMFLLKQSEHRNVGKNKQDRDKNKATKSKRSRRISSESDSNEKTSNENEKDISNESEKVKSSLLNASKDISNESEKVKSSLLNESDSENSGINEQVIGKAKKRSHLRLSDENEAKKKALLNDSDSDSSETNETDNKNCTSNNDPECKNQEASDETSEINLREKIKALLESDSDDDVGRKTGNDADKVEIQATKDKNEGDLDEFKDTKRALLNDSDSDLPNEDDMSKDKQNEIDKDEGKPTISVGNKDDSGDETTQKRKRLSVSPDSENDSNNAKKMSLTYSSSEEDEQLTNTIKNIKDTLLKGDSSDENMDKKSTDSNSKNSKSDTIQEKLPNKYDSNSTNKDESDKEQRRKRKKISRKKIGPIKSEPGDSSSSDTQDDKHINGLTDLSSLKRKRRLRRRTRRSSSSNNSEEAVVTRSKKMAKAPRIDDEDILEAGTASEEASEDDVDCNDQELPTVRLSGLNGDGIDHLAKDDLLGDSDSSDEKDNETENSKKGTSDSDNVKSKRRKANAISSDSEAGSSRKKDPDLKLSDFEDSDDSGTGKKKKRKKKSEDSDGSSGSSDGGKKKRRRIKQVDESDGSGSDNENEGRNKHGRKNIRKVMGKNQLEEATKKAARMEKERIARITERQKMYNNLDFDESGKPDEVVLEKVVLDFDPETKEPLIQVDKGLVKKLKPHQANGIKFMWDACFESVKRIKKDKGSGCILAHCMGLGKTLQVVSLTHTLLTHSDLTGVRRVLVVCPLSTVLNWVNEFNMWLKNTKTDFEVDVYELSKLKQNSERAFQLQQWFENGGVCVLGYEMFRNLSADNVKKYKKKLLKTFQQSLVDPGPDLVVCDEGHLLKNEKTSLSQSMNRVKTLRRIVLTGTPLQNNLKEYYCMVQFVKPNLLGKYNEYLNRFVNPITNGQYTDSTEHDIKIMKRRSHVLHKMLDGAVQRRDYGVLAPFLPPKHEYVLFITLTEVQTKLYQHYLDNYSRRPLAGKSSGFLFPDFQSLQRIWTHPLVLKYNSERYEIMQQKKRDREEEDDSEGSLADFIDDDSTPDESTTEESSDDMSDASDDSQKKAKKKKHGKKGRDKGKSSARRGTRANPVEPTEEPEPDPDIIEVKNENPTEWWIKLVEEEQLEDLRHSHKLVLLFEILRQCEAIGDKLLVFSQSLYSLDLIEHFLGKVDDATQDGRVDEKLGGHVGSWSPGIDYFRLDGSTSCENRSIWCKNFNREDNPRARLFLISTRAGGLGINLVAANRVVIFDVSWNPSHDVQSIFRVYRFGQKKPCYVYRFLAMGTMEEKIYERQVTKQAISKRVIDEQQIDRHYAENDLAELYKFEPEPPSPRPLPPLPKDRLFAEMLKDHDKQIYKYHEHDSLLENKEEETLSEEERKAAWEDFENEKNKPPPAPFPNTWNMYNGLMGGPLAQQQPQIAYAALAGMLRKDMPNVSDQQIRDMLVLMYTNPQMFGGYDFGMMQKMNEAYKYAQPAGMMNPMMNQVMNSVGGMGVGGVGGVGVGGSGLQYEPPWQRQQQQQQQMRLQQLLQQQNSMGAKFYAGGLGSRDPVAMALQQRRAREMLGGGAVGGAGGGSAEAGPERRGRGRPPLQPRVPPTAPAPGDVVNLDSD